MFELEAEDSEKPAMRKGSTIPGAPPAPTPLQESFLLGSALEGRVFPKSFRSGLPSA